VRDQAGCHRWHTAGASFIEHDRELANPDDIAGDDPERITNGDPKSNTGEDSAPRIKTDLRTGATLSGGRKTGTWRRTKLRQFPRFVRC
jgi:hypothetical protein